MRKHYRPEDGVRIFLDGEEIDTGVREVEVDVGGGFPHSSKAVSQPPSVDPVRSLTEDPAYRTQAEILATALRIYGERNVRMKDNWRRGGWRLCLMRLRERVDRAWDALWDGPVEWLHHETEDDLIDLINFAAFTIRAIREHNRDGVWWQ